MGKNKEKKKESQLVIRVEKAEKTAFLALCEALDTSAGREVRRFMRAFVAAKAAVAEAEEDAAPAPKKVKVKKAPTVAAATADAAPPEPHSAPTPETAPAVDRAPTETSAVSAPAGSASRKRNAKTTAGAV